MRKFFYSSNFIIVFIFIVSSQLFTQCSPGAENLEDIDNISKATIDSIVLKPSYKQVVANGENKIHLKIFAYGKNTGNVYEIPQNRLKKEWFKFTTSQGVVTEDGYFSTNDANLIGNEVEVSVSLKNTNIVSNTVSFSVKAPLESMYKEKITIPVVFHIIQTKEEIEDYASTYDDATFYRLLEKMNRIFKGILSDAATKAETQIEFKPAIYAENGKKLFAPGINRVVLEEISPNENGYDQLIIDNKVFWSPAKYLNIWLVSDFNNAQRNFSLRYSDGFTPTTYVQEDGSTPPQGLNVAEYDASVPFTVKQSGILYKLQSLNNVNKQYEDRFNKFDNELIYYIGKYLGLLSTYQGDDFCEDTHNYEANNDTYKEAEGCYFLSENIMDDASGMHTFVSNEQVKRIFWVLKHCPERANWKSKYAFERK